MTTDYDPIAEQYQRSKQQPWRTHIEAYTLMNLVGAIDGQAVLDVACGEGFYTRIIRQQGASRVVGIDLSERMVQLAREQEEKFQSGIEYRVKDARQLAPSEDFDVVVAAYLLNYAKTRTELLEMSSAIAGTLKPGGRFVTVNCNPDLEFPRAPSYRQFGFETEVDGAWQEGSPIRWIFHLEDGPFEIENYYLNLEIHEQVFHKAGFREVIWHQPQLASTALRDGDEEFWAPFLSSSPVAFIECIK